MTPNSEPNSIPPMCADRQEWRQTYAAYVEEYQNSPKTYSDEVRLEIRLKRLGFIGTRLYEEMKYVKEAGK